MKTNSWWNRVFLLLTVCTFAISSQAQTQFWNEDFEDDGQMAGRYSLNTPLGTHFSDGFNDFFGQVPGIAVNTSYVVNGPNNTGYFAGMDMDGDNAGFVTGIISFDDIDISTQSGIELRFLIAEDDDGANQDWDAGDLFYIEVDVDNSGTFTKVIQFASGGGTNTEPGLDTDYDELQDGAFLTDVFTQYTVALAGTGSTMDINVVFDGMDQGDVDAAVDFIELWGTSGGGVPGCTDPSASNYDPAATMDDGSCTYANACNLPGTVVQASSFAYTPSDLSIATGETVVWENIGGLHNVDGTTDVLAGPAPYTNPENFFIADANSTGTPVCLGSYTFTVPGIYNYNCSIGAHAAFGMVATITVGNGGCLDPISPDYDPAAEFDDGSCTYPAPTPCTLFFSEAAEGSSNNKYLEIYNPTSLTIELDNWAYPNTSNAPSVPGEYEFWNTFTPGATIAPGERYLIVHGSADPSLVASADQTNNFLSNGDDAFALVYGTPTDYTIVDIIGTFDADPGSGWEVAGVANGTQNHTIVRKPWVNRGNFNDWTTSAGTGTGDSEWIVNAIDDWTDFDMHTVSGACVPVSGCTNPLASNYNVEASSDDGSCIIPGCMDAGALNYNPDATVDDGSCEFTIPNLVINEINYNPCTELGSDNDWEFIEIYNADAVAVDLEGITISNAVDFTFPAASSIAPDEYIIVVVNAASWVAPSFQVFEWNAGGTINNTGETITLSSPAGLLIDEVTYADSAPWPTSPDLSCSTLELVDPSLDNALPENWQGSYVDNGTPGAMNSEQPPATSYTIEEIQTFATEGEIASTNGVVTGVYAAEYTIQDGTGPYSAVWVIGTGVSLGDEVDVFGEIVEFFGRTQLENTTRVINSTGNPLPAAESLTTGALGDEQWESVLCTSVAPIAQANAGFGNWTIDDGSGQAGVYGLGYDAITLLTLVDGDTYRVTGPNSYDFGQFKFAPRDAADVVKLGCTDILFANYDPDAVEDDGSCSNTPGCTDPDADNYDAAAGVDDGTCIFSGCTDMLALNYDPAATVDDGSCYTTLPGIVITEINYNPCGISADDYVYEFIEILNTDAVDADLSGYTVTQGFDFTFPPGSILPAGAYGVIAYNASTYSGCTNIWEFEWDGLSNSGETIEIQDGFGNQVDIVAYDDAAPWPTEPDTDCSTLELNDPSLDNNDAANWHASLQDYGTPCEGPIEGCTDVFATNYNAEAYIDDGSCFIGGCTDPAAQNYNEDATVDDGSCEYPGCTYDIATNYDAMANFDDGSCTFDCNPVDTCPADLDDSGDVGTGDLLAMLAAFGQVCP